MYVTRERITDLTLIGSSVYNYASLITGKYQDRLAVSSTPLTICLIISTMISMAHHGSYHIFQFMSLFLAKVLSSCMYYPLLSSFIYLFANVFCSETLQNLCNSVSGIFKYDLWINRIIINIERDNAVLSHVKVIAILI